MQIAKQDLQIIRYTHPFDLETINIHEPPESLDPVKAEKIRDDYKFDIVSLDARCLDRFFQTRRRLHAWSGVLRKGSLQADECLSSRRSYLPP
jgi:hypothetical protein